MSNLSDWIASRTIRFNAFFMAIYTAVAPVLFALDEQDLSDLGLSRKAIVIVMAVVGVVQNLGNMRLRAVTDTPIAGRSNAVRVKAVL